MVKIGQTHTNLITLERLKEVLDYNKYTGVFIWKVDTGYKRLAGEIAGYNCTRKYRGIGIDGVKYKEHRLAWFYENGYWPDIIDHINGITYNNWISNLRNVTQSANLQNRNKLNTNNTTGFMGVCYDKSRNKYMSSIVVNYKTKYLGRFSTSEEAHQAYLAAKRKLHNTCTI